MIKSLTITVIKSYQMVRPILDRILISVFGVSSSCRYEESCSRYTLRQIEQHGTIVGLSKGMRRLLKCWQIS